jgi:hypothetical protein
MLASLSPDAQRVARAAGLDADGEHARIENLERLLLLETEVHAAASEIDCLADQIEDLEGELDARESSFELTLTLSSIAAAALTGIAAGIADVSTDSDIGPWIQIGGGVLSAALGALAFFPPRESVELEHSRNVLRAIERDDNDATLPRFVLELLELPRAEGPSPRALLRARWSELLEQEGTYALMFGDGGVYDIETLRLREHLLELLETEIQLEAQDIELLLRELYGRAEPVVIQGDSTSDPP